MNSQPSASESEQDDNQVYVFDDESYMIFGSDGTSVFYNADGTLYEDPALAQLDDYFDPSEQALPTPAFDGDSSRAQSGHREPTPEGSQSQETAPENSTAQSLAAPGVQSPMTAHDRQRVRNHLSAIARELRKQEKLPSAAIGGQRKMSDADIAERSKIEEEAWAVWTDTKQVRAHARKYRAFRDRVAPPKEAESGRR